MADRVAMGRWAARRFGLLDLTAVVADVEGRTIALEPDRPRPSVQVTHTEPWRLLHERYFDAAVEGATGGGGVVGDRAR